MSTHDQLSRQIDQAEATMRDAEARLGQFESLRPLLAELVGRAEALDGRVSVQWSAQGLSALELHPRVMRSAASDELAEAIRTAIAQAIADLREKTRAALADAGIGASSAQSAAEVRAQLGTIRENTIDNARRTASDLDRAMQLRRASGR